MSVEADRRQESGGLSGCRRQRCLMFEKCEEGWKSLQSEDTSCKAVLDDTLFERLAFIGVNSAEES